MEAKVHRRWGSTNGKRVTNRLVFQRYASLKRISERTAEDYFSGRCGPLADVLAMVSVAASNNRQDMVECIYALLHEASQQIQELTPELFCTTQQADLFEDQLEETHRLNPSKETWLLLRRAKLFSIGLERNLIAAGDREYC